MRAEACDGPDEIKRPCIGATAGRGVGDSVGRTVAYLILAHSDPRQLSRLVRTLKDGADCFVHVDAKADAEAFRTLLQPDEVSWLENRLRVSWASYSMVAATMRLMEAALLTQRKYSHLVLLSGQDYPIAPPRSVCEFLNGHPGRQFIRFIDMRESPDHYMRHITRFWLGDRFGVIGHPFGQKLVRQILSRVRRIPLRKKPLPGVIPCFGSQWWALTPDCCRYILEHVRRHREFVDFYRTAFAPDEHFFHTIVANSLFQSQTAGIERFTGVGTYKLANLHHIHPSLTKVYQEADYDEIRASGKMFVRKVESLRSARLLDRIDHDLLGSQVPLRG